MQISPQVLGLSSKICINYVQGCNRFAVLKLMLKIPTECTTYQTVAIGNIKIGIIEKVVKWQLDFKLHLEKLGYLKYRQH